MPQGRRRLLAGLSRVHLPESVESLVRILPHVQIAEQRAVVRALEFHGDPRAVPALRAALEEKNAEPQRLLLLAALVACGLNVDKEATAIEAYARQISSDTGRREWREAKDSYDRSPRNRQGVHVGALLRDGKRADDALTQRLYARADALEAEEPATSQTLRRLLAKWPRAPVAARIVDAIRTRTADLETVTTALEQRHAIAKHAHAALHELATTGGLQGGIASSLCSSSTDGAYCPGRQVLFTVGLGSRLPISARASFVPSRRSS